MRALIVLLVSVVFCFISSSTFAQEKCPSGNRTKCIAVVETADIEGKAFVFEEKCYKISRVQNGDLVASVVKSTNVCTNSGIRATHLGRSQNTTRDDGAIVLGTSQMLLQFGESYYLVRLLQIPVAGI